MCVVVSGCECVCLSSVGQFHATHLKPKTFHLKAFLKSDLLPGANETFDTF